MPIIALAVSVIIMDATVVNVVLPVLIRDINLTASDAEWVISVYALVFAALLITVGRIGDILGRRRHDPADHPLDDQRAVHRAGTRDRLRDLGLDHRWDGGRRTARRRLADDRLQLALGLPDQHPDHDRRAGRHPALGALPSGPAAQAEAETAMVGAARIATLSAAGIILLGLLATIALPTMRRDDEDTAAEAAATGTVTGNATGPTTGTGLVP